MNSLSSYVKILNLKLRVWRKTLGLLSSKEPVFSYGFHGAVVVLSTAVFLLLFRNAPISPDEALSLNNGDLLRQALFSNDHAIRAQAAAYIDRNGLGLWVGVPASMIMRATQDLALSRLVLLPWFVAFYLGVLFVFESVWTRLKVRGNSEFANDERAPLVVGGICTLFIIGAIPEVLLNQLQLLTDVPGSVPLLLSFGMFLRGRPRLGLVLAGAAASVRLNYGLYFPIALAWYWFDKNRDGRSILHAVLLYFCVPIIFQVLKITAYGIDSYFSGWLPFFRWLVAESGSGFIQSTEQMSDFARLSWKPRMWFFGGALFPVLILALAKLKVIRIPRKLMLCLAVFSSLVGAAALHWLFVMDLQWWRRSLYFLIPSYVMCLSIGLSALAQRFVLKKMNTEVGIILFLVLAGVLAARQIIGIHQKPELTRTERASIEWVRP